MSICGKYDLYDHIRNIVLKPKDGSNVEESDIMECFNVFKERTGGVIYQHKKVVVSEYNAELIAKYYPFFKVIEHKKIKEDKRFKEGKKELTTYSYEYYGKEYKTLNELNRHGVWIEFPIKFNKIVELIPYFPYIITACSSSENKEHIIISKESYIETLLDEYLKYGLNSAEAIFYWNRQTLGNVTQDIILNYLGDYKERVVIKEYKINKENDNFIIKLDEPIDVNFDVEIIKDNKLLVWGSPEIIDDYTISLKNSIVNIGNAKYIKIKYIKRRE